MRLHENDKRKVENRRKIISSLYTYFHTQPAHSNIQRGHQTKASSLAVLWRRFCLDLMEGEWKRERVQGLGECFCLRQNDFKGVCFCWWLWSSTRTAADGAAEEVRLCREGGQGVTEWVCGCCWSCYGSVYGVLIKSKSWEDSVPELKTNDPWLKSVMSARCTAWSCFICGFI